MLDPRNLGDWLTLNIREGVEDSIYNHYLDDKESLADNMAQIYQECNSLRA
jgi:hypothetical protein